ncbi:MAG: hypothetical protein HY051_05895 [Candidatus Aenigmarchaeota archaeon]|nr:hypothetical protein [Candidatus Aenigmarchaeota archaeon]
MTTQTILARVSHGNEPIIRALKIASHFPECDIVLPVPQSKAAFLGEIANGNNVDKKRVYIDTVAHALADGMGLYWGGDLSHEQWVANNTTYMDHMDRILKDHYGHFWAKNLDGEEKNFEAQNVKMVLNIGDFYDQLGVDAPVVYEFPYRHGALFQKSRSAGYAGFGKFLEAREKQRSVSFVPLIHSLYHDSRYRPLGNEEFAPHMKEEPADFDLALPENSIGMVFSGTGKKVDVLKRIAAHSTHPIVTGTFSPVEGDRYVKMEPPRAEFVHVYAKPQILAVVGQTGYGMLGNTWNAGKPVISPVFEEGDDQEFIHNLRTIKKLGLGVVVETPDQIDAAVEKSQACVEAVLIMNQRIRKEFETLDGPSYVARRIRELGLY